MKNKIATIFVWNVFGWAIGSPDYVISKSF